MRRILLISALAASFVPANAHAATVLAQCGISTPRIAPPSVPPNNLPVDPVEECPGQTFTLGVATSVTTLLNPDDGFFGIVGLRVRGPNALYSQFEGTFANGTFVAGEETRTFTLPAGSWTFDVYLGGSILPAGSPFRSTGSLSVGTYRGSISA
jgi:hypothetical protein